MTIIACVADVHLANHRRHGGPVHSGINQRASESFAVLNAAVDLALERGAAAFVVLGDLFDVDDPEPQLIAAAQGIFGKAKGRMRVVLVVGNHDQQSASPGDHALGPLAPVAEVIEEPTMLDVEGVSFGIIPFRTGAASDWLKKAVDDLFKDAVPFGGGKILGVHLGIADDDTAPFLRGAHDAIHVNKLFDIGKAHGITKVFAGNWHNRARWEGEPTEPAVFQIGALIPTGWDNEGHRGFGGVAFYDSSDETAKVETLPGPRFLDIDSLEGLRALKSMGSGYTKLYVRAELPRKDVTEGLSVLDELKQLQVIVAGEVLTSKEEAREHAREAARAAGTAKSLDTALAGFIEKMDPGEGVARAEVLRLSKNYLQKGSAT